VRGTSRSVVVGVDDDVTARAATVFAAEEAGARDLPLCLVHVVPCPNPVAAATRYADRRVVVARNRPAAALVDASRTAELLVVGRSHRLALGRLASPTHGVLQRAGCPIAVIPTGATPEGSRP
jgi:Universal stress protein family